MKATYKFLAFRRKRWRSTDNIDLRIIQKELWKDSLSVWLLSHQPENL
jgi:hypothetical protein